MAEEQEKDDYKLNQSSIKDVNELMKKDSDDESLRKWKEQLLGKALNEEIAPKGDPRRVVIKELIIVTEEKGEWAKYKFDTKEQVDKLKDTPFTLKEGCNYKIVIRFKVQHELVTGLKYVNTVHKAGIRVGKVEVMIGSYAPQAAFYEVVIPRRDWETAPSGFLSSGKYKAKSQFIDDDKVVHLEYEYAFALCKDWS